MQKRLPITLNERLADSIHENAQAKGISEAEVMRQAYIEQQRLHQVILRSVPITWMLILDKYTNYQYDSESLNSTAQFLTIISLYDAMQTEEPLVDILYTKSWNLLQNNMRIVEEALNDLTTSKITHVATTYKKALTDLQKKRNPLMTDLLNKSVNNLIDHVDSIELENTCHDLLYRLSETFNLEEE